MKLIKSLTFREVKMSGKHYIVRGVLLVTMFALFSLALFVQEAPEKTNSEYAEFLSFIVFTCNILAALSAILAGGDNGVFKSDLNTGWRRYALALPISACSQAAAGYIVKLVMIVIGAVVSAVFAAVVSGLAGQSLVISSLSVYFMILSAELFFETIFSALILHTGNSRHMKIISLSTVAVVLVLIFVVPSVLLDNIENIESFDTTSFVNAVTEKLLNNAPMLFVVSLLVFIAVIIVGFMITLKSLERRVP